MFRLEGENTTDWLGLRIQSVEGSRPTITIASLGACQSICIAPAICCPPARRTHLNNIFRAPVVFFAPFPIYLVEAQERVPTPAHCSAD